MECLFAPELEPHSVRIELPPDEVAHARALRLRHGDTILLTNARGLCARAVFDTNNKQLLCRISEILPEHNEHKTFIHLALGVLDNRDRWEFALEKATELGVREITPLAAMFSQRHTINHQRTEAKLLAAVKQAQRAYLPVLHKTTTLQQLLEQINPDTLLLQTDISGAIPTMIYHSQVTILVGPEGGFSPEEQLLINKSSLANRLIWRLAPARLRAETAVISAVALVTGNTAAFYASSPSG